MLTPYQRRGDMSFVLSHAILWLSVAYLVFSLPQAREYWQVRDHELSQSKLVHEIRNSPEWLNVHVYKYKNVVRKSDVFFK